MITIIYFSCFFDICKYIIFNFIFNIYYYNDMLHRKTHSTNLFKHVGFQWVYDQVWWSPIMLAISD